MRIRFVVALVALVVVSGVVSYGLVHARLAQVSDREVARDLEAGERRVRAELSMMALEASDAVDRAAGDARLAVALRGRGDERRAGVFRALTEIADGFSRERAGLGRPDVLVAMDGAGRVLARDVDATAWVGRNLRAEWPVVARGLASSSVGVVFAERRAYLVAVRAVGPDAAVALGYALGDGVAERLARTAGGDVIVYAAGRALGGSERDVARRRMLEGGALEEHRAAADAALAGQPTTLVEGRFASVSFAYRHGRIEIGGESVGVVVARDDRARSRVVSVADMLLFLTAVLGMLAVFVAMRLADMVLRPIFALESTLAAMIEGERNPPLDLFGTPLGGVAYRVHELVNHLVPPDARRPTGGAGRVR